MKSVKWKWLQQSINCEEKCLRRNMLFPSETATDNLWNKRAVSLMSSRYSTPVLQPASSTSYNYYYKQVCIIYLRVRMCNMSIPRSDNNNGSWSSWFSSTLSLPSTVLSNTTDVTMINYLPKGSSVTAPTQQTAVLYISQHDTSDFGGREDAGTRVRQ